MRSRRTHRPNSVRLELWKEKSNLDLVHRPASIPAFQRSRGHASSDDFSHLLQEFVSTSSCGRLARHISSCEVYLGLLTCLETAAVRTQKFLG